MKKKLEILVLPLFCVVVALLLSLTNALTKPYIAAAADREKNAGRYALLPEATGFEDLPVGAEITAEFGIQTAAAAGGGGMVLEGTVPGYGGPIAFTVAVGPDGTIVGVLVGANSETPGLGKRIEEPAFLAQFEGLSGEIAITKDGGPVDAIASATISSRAIAEGVDNALKAYDKLKEAA